MLVSNRLRTVVISIAVLFGLWVWLWEPFKVTDPDDPRFDPLRFKFSDYRPDEWQFPLRKMFHPGDPRARVEDILMKRAGAWSNLIMANFVSYNWHPWYSNINLYGILVIYDDQDRLVAMMTTRNGDVFNKPLVKSTLEQSMREPARTGEEYKRRFKTQRGEEP